MLGTPIGHPAFIDDFKESRRVKARRSLERMLDQVSDPEQRYRLFYYCILPKLNHLHSLASSEIESLTFAENCGGELSIFLESLLSIDKETLHYTEAVKLASLDLDCGGLRLFSSKDYRIAAQVAVFARLFTSIHPDLWTNLGEGPLHSGFRSRLDDSLLGYLPTRIGELLINETTMLSSCTPYFKYSWDCIEKMVNRPNIAEYCESVDVASPKRTKCFQLLSMGPIPLLQHKLTKCITDPQLKLFFREQASLSDSRYTRILPSTTQTLSYSFLEGASLGFGSQPNTWLMFVLY